MVYVAILIVSLTGTWNGCLGETWNDVPELYCDSGFEAYSAPDAENHLLEHLSLFAGIDGSKQPQDYGVNANLGGRTHINWSGPLISEFGIGMQVGTALQWSDNAVRVYELLGQSTTRFQNYATIGLFQNVSDRLRWGVVYDHLYEDSYDQISLSQIRSRVSFHATDRVEVGSTVHLGVSEETASFGSSTVELSPINQATMYLRGFFPTGVTGTGWIGLAEGHGESNAVTGFSPAAGTSLVFGADFTAPLTQSLAIYGETNLMMPADTGTVDAFLGLVWCPKSNGHFAGGKYSPLMPLAAATSMSIDLRP